MNLIQFCSDVNDIDLFMGALAETPLKGAVVGPTFGCILAHQFSLLRKADRFWYENDVPPSSFTKEQLQEIRKTSLAGLICKNFENVKFISPKVFHEKDNFL
jgi:peroxidase